MANGYTFWQHFDDAYKALSGKHKSILTEDKLFQAASEIAAKLVDIDFKEKENSYSYQRAQTEFKNLILQSKTQNEMMQIEKLKALVQAHAMLLSVGDNAAINKANAIVSFANVAANASNPSLVSQYDTKVMTFINQIENKDLSKEYTPLLDKIKDLANLDFNESRGMEEVGILTPRIQLKPNEAVELEGWTMYPNNEQYFQINDTQYKGNKLFYISEKTGEQEIFFKAKNDQNKLLIASVKIRVQ